MTHTGTTSLRGQVKVMARRTVGETNNRGLRLRPYRPFNVGRGVKDERERKKGSETLEPIKPFSEAIPHDL